MVLGKGRLSGMNTMATWNETTEVHYRPIHVYENVKITHEDYEACKRILWTAHQNLKDSGMLLQVKHQLPSGLQITIEVDWYTSGNVVVARTLISGVPLCFVNENGY